MAAIKITNIDNRPFLLGDNEFETVKVTVGADATIKRGALLYRNGDAMHPWDVTVTTSDPVALVVDDIVNTSAADADIPCRVIISGKVNRTFVNIAGADITDEQSDMIRKYGILAMHMKDLSILDNQ